MRSCPLCGKEIDDYQMLAVHLYRGHKRSIGEIERILEDNKDELERSIESLVGPPAPLWKFMVGDNPMIILLDEDE